MQGSVSGYRDCVCLVVDDSVGEYRGLQFRVVTFSSGGNGGGRGTVGGGKYSKIERYSMMRKWLVVLILLVGSLPMFAGEEKNDSGENRELVYKVDIKDEIGPNIWRLVKRSFDRATDENADVILVHMNTYGGW